MGRHIVAASLALGMVAGCSWLTDFTSLSSGGPLPDGADAHIDGAAGAEAGASDAGVDADADADASGCARYPDASFCEDFEGQDPLAMPPWTQNEALDNRPTPRGTIVVGSDDAVSKPHLARFDVRNDHTNCEYLRLTRNFPGTFTHLEIHVALRSKDVGAYVWLNATPSPDLAFNVLIGLDSETQISATSQQYVGSAITQAGRDQANTATPWAGQWLDVTLDYVTTATENTVTVQIPGLRVLSYTLPATFVLKDPIVGFGPYCVTGSPSASVDDVAVFAIP